MDWNDETVSPFVKMSAFCSLVSILLMVIEFGFSLERNQWYLIAKCFDLGVTRPGSIEANIKAPALSSHTVVLKLVTGSGSPTLCEITFTVD